MQRDFFTGNQMETMSRFLLTGKKDFVLIYFYICLKKIKAGSFLQ